MREVQVRRYSDDVTLARRVRVADGFWSRVRGLLGSAPLQADQGLLLQPCRAVHTLGMRQPLDVIFLDETGIVVAAYRQLPPNRRTDWHRRAVCALELSPGTLERTGTRTGSRLSLEPHRAQ